MVRSFIILFLGTVIIFFSSCSREYVTATSITPVSQAPVNTKQKGDLNIHAAYTGQDATNTWKGNNFYQFITVDAFSFSGNYAVSDNFTLGLKYQFNINQPYTGHAVTPSFNYSKNYEVKRTDRGATYGFDILSGLQISTGNNFMEVSDYLHDYYVLLDTGEVSVIYYDVEKYPLGYYRIKQNDLRLFVQPSFSYENNFFEFFIGTNIGWHQNLKYAPQLNTLYQAYFEDPTEYNPMVYYGNNRSFIFGESFYGMGLGPEYCRVVWIGGLGYTSDQMQHTYAFGSIGIRSNFNVKKKEK
ncbi:MAG: hypothetical protein R2753_06750 [Chitinophagales bacterium]